MTEAKGARSVGRVDKYLNIRFLPQSHAHPGVSHRPFTSAPRPPSQCAQGQGRSPHGSHGRPARSCRAHAMRAAPRHAIATGPLNQCMCMRPLRALPALSHGPASMTIERLCISHTVRSPQQITVTADEAATAPSRVCARCAVRRPACVRVRAGGRISRPCRASEGRHQQQNEPLPARARVLRHPHTSADRNAMLGEGRPARNPAPGRAYTACNCEFACEIGSHKAAALARLICTLLGEEGVGLNAMAKLRGSRGGIALGLHDVAKGRGPTAS
jgi:hypothetical protein